MTSDANFETTAELSNRSYITVLDHSIGETFQRLVFVTPFLKEVVGMRTTSDYANASKI